MLLGFTLGPAEIVVLASIPVLIFVFVYRAGKNAGRAKAMQEELDNRRGSFKDDG